VTAVLGANGAGKTSTIEVCEGYRRATSGTVRVLGLDPASDQRKLSERIGVMLQEGGIYPSARVADAVRHYCALYERGADPAALVDLVGLRDRAAATWRRLSGGERQRLSLALALAARPDVAFLDEPTSGVDVNGRDTIRSVVRDLSERGCAVVLATHELDEAERVADRVVIFDSGRIVADGTLASSARPRPDPVPERTGPRRDGARRRARSPGDCRRRRRVHPRGSSGPAPDVEADGLVARTRPPAVGRASRRAASGGRVPAPHGAGRRR
jgi:ABC-2 type transport system ATP-binding protein